MDRIILEEHDGERRRRCVNCGHSDTMTTGAAVEPPTRVSRRPEADVPTTPVRIVDPRRQD